MVSPQPNTGTAGAARTAAGAAATARQRLREEGLRTVLVLAAVSLCVALLLTALDGRGFLSKLVYALCIGLVCTVIVDGTRVATAWLSDTLRRRRGLPIDDSPAVTGWRGVLPGALLAVLLGPPAGLWLADQITGGRSPSLLDFGTSARITLGITVIATVVTVVVVSTLERLSAVRAEAEAARRQAAENQLRLLQSQLEPHMLFNTLANLRVLIGLDPQRAQAMLDRLINFLRATLKASRLATQPLAAEFAHLDDYLALMAIRMGPRLAVRWQLPDELRSLPVPTLLLQPLVENAIKHGLEPRVEGGCIEIAAQREGDLLLLTVRDTGVGLSAPAATAATAGTAFGLEQVRTRLATLYGARAALHLQPADDADGGTRAILTLPLS
jgi:signal transduction histidine kinase